MLRADVSTQEQEYIKDRCVISRKEKTQPRLSCHWRFIDGTTITFSNANYSQPLT